MFQVVPAAVRNKENNQEKNIIYRIRDNSCLEETVSQIFFYSAKKAIYICLRVDVLHCHIIFHCLPLSARPL